MIDSDRQKLELSSSERDQLCQVCDPRTGNSVQQGLRVQTSTRLSNHSLQVLVNSKPLLNRVSNSGELQPECVRWVGALFAALSHCTLLSLILLCSLSLHSHISE